MTTDQINAWIDRYAAAIRALDARAVAECYAEAAEIYVHGLADAGSAWNSKHSTGNAGVQEEYERFFELVADFEVDYTDRIISPSQGAAAMIVRISGTNADGSTFNRANALHLTFDGEGRIAVMRNWYGDA